MKIKLAILVLGASLLIYCSRVPVTGRRQLDLLPSNQILALASTNYKDFLSQNKISNDASSADKVKRVGQNIAAAVTKYMNDKGLGDQLKGYNWEFNLIESKELNAWCMPGGKVVVYTGILPVTQDEAGLAVVMGHEIAHAIAKHGNERMSQGLVQQLGGVALQVAMNDKPEQTRALFNTAYGAGTSVGVMLPFSRLQESEADRLGLIFMAMAGYDPRVAPDFWKRMEAQSKGGGSTPELLSTHPAPETRIQDIQKHMPEALSYYTGKQ